MAAVVVGSNSMGAGGNSNGDSGGNSGGSNSGGKQYIWKWLGRSSSGGGKQRQQQQELKSGIGGSSIQGQLLGQQTVMTFAVVTTTSQQ